MSGRGDMVYTYMGGGGGLEGAKGTQTRLGSEENVYLGENSLAKVFKGQSSSKYKVVHHSLNFSFG